MKTLKELEAIRQKTLNELNLRKNREDGIRVVVGLATCGIAAGARPVMAAFVDEVNKRQLTKLAASDFAAWNPSWKSISQARRR